VYKKSDGSPKCAGRGSTNVKTQKDLQSAAHHAEFSNDTNKIRDGKWNTAFGAPKSPSDDRHLLRPMENAPVAGGATDWAFAENLPERSSL
jgi:hypothetical protein